MKVFEFFKEKIFSWQKFTCFVKSKKEKKRKGKIASKLMYSSFLEVIE
jgi:hypothetical protein